MEYGDFLYLNLDTPLLKHIDFLEYLTWLSANNFAPLESHLFQTFSLKNQLPNRSTDDIIAGMIVTSENDFEKKAKSDNYYVCCAHALLAVMRHIFTVDFLARLKAYNTNSATRFLVENYQDILLWLLRDFEDLTSLYAEKRQARHHQLQQQEHTQQGGEKAQQGTQGRVRQKFRSYIRNRYVHTASLYQVFRQGLFGSISDHSFSDREPSANIATIRQLIELRLRRAIGALAFEDTQNNNAVEPLNMKPIFKVLYEYKNQIKIEGIQLESIKRIYTWSNSFIHSGLGDYSWIPFYLEIVLRDLAFGHGENHNFNSGITTTADVIRSIWIELIKLANEGKCDQNVRYRLSICKPECILRASSPSSNSVQDSSNRVDKANRVANTGIRNTEIENIAVENKGGIEMANNVVKFTVSQPPADLSLKAKLAWIHLTTREGKQFVRTEDGHWLFFEGDINKAKIFCNDTGLAQWLEEVTNSFMAGDGKLKFLQGFCPAVPELIDDNVATQIATIL